MNKTYSITTNHINQLITTFNECGVTEQDIGVDFDKLQTLTTQQDIEKYLVEYLVGFGLIKLSDDQQLTYKNFDLTEYYQDAYFRYFEDVE